MNQKLKGKYYEDLACEYLIKNGYEIIERNKRYKKIEIDIIAKKNNEIIICEVKYRCHLDFLTISKKQRENIDNFIYLFYFNENVRFDLIIFTLNDFSHIENVYL